MKEIEKPTADEIEQKIKDLKERKQIYQSYQEQLEESKEKQIVITDPDSRLMRTGHNGRDVCYNVQIAVDNKFKLIAAVDVTSDENDIHQLSKMTDKIKKNFDLERFETVSDVGYFEKNEIKECRDNGIYCYVPEPKKSKNFKKNKFTNKDFQYDSDEDCYICPGGHKLRPTGTSIKHNRKEMCYKTSACKS